MSTATLVVALAAQPAETVVHGKQVLEVFASTNGKDQVPVLLRCVSGSKTAEAMKPKPAGQSLIVAGDLLLENSQPVLFVRSLCDVPSTAYINEVTITGRLAREPRITESNKSASRSVAVNRWNNGEEVTDWFNVRGYGYTMERLVAIPVGSLVLLEGSLDLRTNRDGQPYAEIKARSIHTFERGKGGKASNNLAEGTQGIGYEQADFEGSPDSMPPTPATPRATDRPATDSMPLDWDS